MMAVENHKTCSSRLYWAVAGFGLSLFLPSTAIVQRHLGLAGVAAYLLVASALLLLLVRHRHALAKRASRLTGRQVLWLATLTFLLVLAAFLIVYPIADSGVVGGGSDNDDALDGAATELLHGRHPYYARNYRGNATPQLPGAVILAAPFVLLGYSAYQNIFWLLAFFVAMKHHFRDSRLALLLVWAIFALSPVVLYEILVGSDRMANSLYVLLAVLWMVRAISSPGLPRWQVVVPAIFMGVTLSSRANFLLLLPLVFSAMVRAAGWKRAGTYAAITGATFLAVTLPFYLYDPSAFSPLDTSAKLGQFEPVLPLAGLLVPLATLILALILAVLQPESRDQDALLRNCAIVLAFPVLCGIVLRSVKVGGVGLSFAAYGTFLLFFGAVAFWGRIFEGTALRKLS